MSHGYLHQKENKFINKSDTTTVTVTVKMDQTLPNTSYQLYKTGDFGCRLDDGRIKYIGRVDDQVKVTLSI